MGRRRGAAGGGGVGLGTVERVAEVGQADGVQVGRAELSASTSVSDYLARSQVLAGYGTLEHASALVANACGFTLAPPSPF